MTVTALEFDDESERLETFLAATTTRHVQALAFVHTSVKLAISAKDSGKAASTSTLSHGKCSYPALKIVGGV